MEAGSMVVPDSSFGGSPLQVMHRQADVLVPAFAGTRGSCEVRQPMRNTRIAVKPIAGAIGAEIEGVDITAAPDNETIAEIRQALLDPCVIFFRGQNFDAAQHKAFARRFGDIFIHPNYRGMQADNEI